MSFYLYWGYFMIIYIILVYEVEIIGRNNVWFLCYCIIDLFLMLFVIFVVLYVDYVVFSILLI